MILILHCSPDFLSVNSRQPQLVIQEANQAAKELKLQEELPITKSNLVESFVGPFGFSYAHRKIGNVTTKNYMYGVEQGDKFSTVASTHELEACQKFLKEGYAWPISRIDTSTAYQLATQWLSAVHMNVTALNRDCRVKITVDTVYAEAPPGKFIPTYWVSWIPTNGESPCVAGVRLFTPTKTLLYLTVEDSKYILRKPLVFTNLTALFPGSAPVYTNFPVPPVYMSAPPP